MWKRKEGGAGDGVARIKRCEERMGGKKEPRCREGRGGVNLKRERNDGQTAKKKKRRMRDGGDPPVAVADRVLSGFGCVERSKAYDFSLFCFVHHGKDANTVKYCKIV